MANPNWKQRAETAERTLHRIRDELAEKTRALDAANERMRLLREAGEKHSCNYKRYSNVDGTPCIAFKPCAICEALAATQSVAPSVDAAPEKTK